MTGSTRRQLLALCGAAGVAQVAPALAIPQTKESAPPLRAEPGSVLLNENAPPTPVWLFDGVAPGPALRGRLGDDLALPIENALPSPIAVRVYGLRGQVSRVAIPAGARGVLRATPHDAGTFWYAAEDRLADPNARGLVGAFIVEEREEHAYDVDRDLAIVLDAWPVRADGRLGVGPVAATLLANGRDGLVEPAHPGERLRLRMINVAPDRRFRVALDGWSGWIIALDGNPLAAVEPVARLDLWPGQSADIVVDAPPTFGATTALVDVAAGGQRTLAMFIADGASLDPLDYAPPPLPPRATLPYGDPMDASEMRAEVFAPGGPPISVARGEVLRLSLAPMPTDSVLTVEGMALRLLDGSTSHHWRHVVGLPARRRTNVAVMAAEKGDWAIERRALARGLVERAVMSIGLMWTR